MTANYTPEKKENVKQIFRNHFTLFIHYQFSRLDKNLSCDQILICIETKNQFAL